MLKAIKLSGNMSRANLERTQFDLNLLVLCSTLPVYLRTRVDNDTPSLSLTRPPFLEVLKTMFITFLKMWAHDCDLVCQKTEQHLTQKVGLRLCLGARSSGHGSVIKRKLRRLLKWCYLDIAMRCHVQVTDTLHICLPRACQGGGRVGRSGVPGSIVNLSYELIINI